MKLKDILREAGYGVLPQTGGSEPSLREFITQMRQMLSTEISNQVQKNSQLPDKKAAYVGKGYINGLSHAMMLLDQYLKNKSFTDPGKKTFGAK